MIKTREDLIKYLHEDKLALGRRSKSPGATDLIWKFQIALRKYEYYRNKNSIWGEAVRELNLRKIVVAKWQEKPLIRRIITLM